MATTLNARPRTGTGKGVARKLRQAGEVPAVAYGHGEDNRSLTVNAHELELLLKSINPETTIIELRIEGAAPVPVLIRDVQHHPLKPVVLHVDFFQIHADEKLHVAVPVRLHGIPAGVREDGGILQEVIRELSVECLPNDIPAAIDVNVDELKLGESISVGDLPVPANVTVLNDPELVICTVSAPAVAELPEDAVEEEGIGEVEPELIRDRKQEAEPSDEGAAE
jgi:large subunit ribosomal protein L25